MLVTVCERSRQTANSGHKQASRVLLLMSIHYRGISDVDELDYAYVNEILDVRLNEIVCVRTSGYTGSAARLLIVLSLLRVAARCCALLRAGSHLETRSP